MGMKASFATLGCKVNQYDTQAIRELFESEGYESVAFDEVADVYVINTCTVTETGDKKSRQMISRARSQNPDAVIIVAGCYAQRAPDEVLSIDGVSAVIGTKDRKSIIELVSSIKAGTTKLNAVGELRTQTRFEELSSTREGRTRAHLKIQEGCDRYCSYCIIPYARGPIRSRPLESVKRELLKLADEGYKEIVLTGIHLMSYGKELRDGTTLVDAIEQADDIDAIRRIRLGSLEPQLLDGDTIGRLADNKKVCRQFHLSLQSGSASVLKRMNRRYTPEEYLECVKDLRLAMPGCAITTDIIAGFPGETEEEFNETLEFVKLVGFSRIHAFPYSRREGTKAYDMPGQLTHAVKHTRTAKLIALGKALEAAYLDSLTGTDAEVLFEQYENGRLSGYTGTYAHVSVSANDDTLCGELKKVYLCGVTDGYIDGIITGE